MRILRLLLDDFRQFHGHQSITFGMSGNKNVSVIYAANGAGKTTILNAFTWVLYNKLSDDFEQPDRIINNVTWDECAVGQSASTTVSIEFEHDGRIFTATRRFEARKSDDGSPLVLEHGKLSLRYIDDDGEVGEIRNPGNAIDQILPERLHRFFFFNGERIEHLVKPSAYKEIEQAIKTLLGLEAVERGIRHTDDAVRTLRRDLRRVAGGETQGILDEIERLKGDRDRHVETKETLGSQLSALREESAAIQQRLREMEDTRAHQERRDQLQKRFAESEQTERDLNQQLRTDIERHGYVAFTEELVSQTLELVETNRLRGELPAPLKRQFVEDLLSDGTCICGTELIEGQAAYENVALWRRRAGIADVEESLIRVGAEAEHFATERAGLNEALSRTSALIAQQRQHRTTLGEELDEVSAKLADMPLEEAQQLEARRGQVDSDTDTRRYEIQRERAEIDAIDSSIRLKERELERIQEANAQAEIAHRRVSVATEARDLLDAVREMRTHDVRSQLDELIREVYSAISFKPYTPVLNEEFQLELRDLDRNGALVARSTGENQILSLSFVGALAEMARRRSTSEESDGDLGSLMGFDGGSYPVVMDAAFGALDDNYRRSVAQALPDLTDQVIVLVSKSQGLGSVQEELQSRISDQYVVQFHTPKPDVEPETIAVSGNEYPYITRSDNGREWASLEQIR